MGHEPTNQADADELTRRRDEEILAASQLTVGEMKRRLAELPDDASFNEVACSVSPDVQGKGGIKEWKPVVDPAVDYSRYGAWEAWQWLKIVDDGQTVQVVPTGEWGAWNREAPLELIVFQGGKQFMSAKEQALALCNSANGSLQPTPEQLQNCVEGKGGHPREWKVNPLAKLTRVVQPFPSEDPRD